MREVDSLLGSADTLVLMVSRDCNIGCSFCCVPPDGHRLPEALCTDLVEQAHAIDGLELVAFTGGEPFLYFPSIPRTLQRLRELELPWKAISNAYWAEDDETARQTLTPLIELGLVQLSLSADPSHQQFLPKERVEVAARVALDLGLRVHVVGSFLKRDMKVRDFVTLPEHPRLHTASYVVQPFGRAKDWRLTQERYGFREQPEEWTCYSTSRYDVLVFPDGDVYPCCSTANDHSDLVYGNVHHDRLAPLYARVKDDFAVQMLKRRNFAELYEAVRQVDPELHAELPDPGAHVSACHLCLSVLSDPALSPRVRRALEEHRATLIAEQLTDAT